LIFAFVTSCNEIPGRPKRALPKTSFILFCLVSLAFTGCTPDAVPPAGAPATQQSNAIISEQMESLTADELRAVSDQSPDGAYRLGPDDLISISVYLHPELNVPIAGQTGNGDGALITSDGTVELPLIGSVKLGGLTLQEAQAVLTADYATFVVHPNITVQINQAQSLRYYLLGAFSSPGVKFPVHPLTLLEALALGGTVDIPQADLYQAYVAQGSVKLPIDLYALLLDGDLSQNIELASGDVIVIPTSSSEAAFVFGAVGKPGPVPFTPAGLSLLQALSSAGLDLPNYTAASLSSVHIIRAHGRTAAYMIINADLIMNGQAAPFALEPGDIVFVPPTGVATWNQVLSQLIPSLQTVSAVLNPFVAIKYLSK
jgi:polysaccharide export outer membrane protein